MTSLESSEQLALVSVDESAAVESPSCEVIEIKCQKQVSERQRHVKTETPVALTTGAHQNMLHWQMFLTPASSITLIMSSTSSRLRFFGAGQRGKSCLASLP